MIPVPLSTIHPLRFVMCEHFAASVSAQSPRPPLWASHIPEKRQQGGTPPTKSLYIELPTLLAAHTYIQSRLDAHINPIGPYTPRHRREPASLVPPSHGRQGHLRAAEARARECEAFAPGLLDRRET